MRRLIIILVVVGAVGGAAAWMFRGAGQARVANAGADAGRPASAEAAAPAVEVSIEGTVTDPAGRPVAGAAVALVTDASIPMTLTAGELRAGDESVSPLSAKTDVQGRFKLPAVSGQMLRDEAFMVAAAHPEAGYAEVRGDAAAAAARPGPVEMRLAPWARFEGTLSHGGAPAGGVRVRLAQSPLTGPQLWAEEEATADARG